jgi:UDP-glucose 4-epimerase
MRTLRSAESRFSATFQNAKVLVTGGAGLIGSNLARRLTAFGARVTIVDSLLPEFGGNIHNIRGIESEVHFNISDIRDTRGMRVLVKDQKFIFNLAGQTSHIDSMTAPFEDLEINCHAQLALLETCRIINSGAKIIFASTRQIYGRPQYLPVDEQHPLVPVDVNGIHKIAGESYHLLYNNVYGLNTSILRLTNVFGPGMRIKDARQMFLGVWIRRLLTDEPFEVWGGDQLRDFTFVEDVVDAFLTCALSSETDGQVFNVGGSEPMSLNVLAETLIAANGGRGQFIQKEFPPERKPIDIGDYYTDDRRFRAATGWKPRTLTDEALRRTVVFYRDNLDNYL